MNKLLQVAEGLLDLSKDEFSRKYLLESVTPKHVELYSKNGCEIYLTLTQYKLISEVLIAWLKRYENGLPTDQHHYYYEVVEKLCEE